MSSEEETWTWKWECDQVNLQEDWKAGSGSWRSTEVVRRARVLDIL